MRRGSVRHALHPPALPERRDFVRRRQAAKSYKPITQKDFLKKKKKKIFVTNTSEK
jgi:hypothetical protein